jgi:hypothetical protein
MAKGMINYISLEELIQHLNKTDRNRPLKTNTTESLSAEKIEQYRQKLNDKQYIDNAIQSIADNKKLIK